MTNKTDSESATDHAPRTTDEFRWQAFFQRAREPFFLLNRQCRILFVNQAWEALTALPAAEARGLACTRRQPAQPEDAWQKILAHALTPLPEVLDGQPARARRPVFGSQAPPRWWDVEFFPLRDDKGLLCILGKITAAETADLPPLAEQLVTLRENLARNLSEKEAKKLWQPETLLALRERMMRHYRFDQLPCSSPALRRTADQARLASQTQAAVFLLGEAGTGKQWLARAIHYQSSSRERPFAALDCASLPPAALATALFGEGGLLQAGIGTLYLKEPSCLPRDFQARLCNWRSGSAAGPRLLASCRGNPAEEVRSGRLLADLYTLLGTLVIELPPLRERQADLPWLVEQFLERAQGEGPRRIVGLTPEAWELVRAHAWPGNLRELYTVLSGACTHAGGEPQATHLGVADLPAYLRLLMRLEKTPAAEPPRLLPLDQLLEQTERRLILLALHRAQGNKTRAAELLGIWRQRLLRRMEALEIADTEGELEIEPEEGE